MAENKPAIGVKPYWLVAWTRIEDLANGIIRQCEISSGDLELIEKFAYEIILQKKLLVFMLGKEKDGGAKDVC